SVTSYRLPSPLLFYCDGVHRAPHSFPTRRSSDLVEEAIRNMQIVAPFDGTVVSLDAQLGETVNTMSLGTSGGRSAIVTIADLAHLEVETDVAESLLSRIAPGQPAETAVGAVPGRTYRGRLSKIIPQGDRSRATVKVEVTILDPDDRLFPELAATVHFL